MKQQLFRSLEFFFLFTDEVLSTTTTNDGLFEDARTKPHDPSSKVNLTPLIVNTSFNLNYEPIVCSPKDAISSFFNSGLDFLCIEGILIEK